MTTQALQDNTLFQTGYLVNGLWKPLDTTFDVLNPATGEVIARVAKAGKQRPKQQLLPPPRLSLHGAPKPRKSVRPFFTAGTN